MAQPVPAPPLDGNPPSPPGMNAAPSPTMQQLTPGQQMGGNMQKSQLVLQAGAQAAKLIDLIGQIQPEAAPTAQMLIEQLRGLLRTILQQGMSGSEPSFPGAQGGVGGPPQAPPPMLPSGMGQ